ncbi:hypothetical protein [Alloalcanivorax profundimaris]|uniref:hypothetical protein n=1 Tax=Alloalcanivorax profundimaris TaxID=2735259 RepID=UPI001891B0A6|nr:hypothetical protein [Alloalcanivorax profundimaris]
MMLTSVLDIFYCFPAILEISAINAEPTPKRAFLLFIYRESVGGSHPRASLKVVATSKQIRQDGNIPAVYAKGA